MLIGFLKMCVCIMLAFMYVYLLYIIHIVYNIHIYTVYIPKRK